ncbi:MAG: histidine--tRNA ligase [Syntrophomonadaceae bacterium]|nr:histidine--tRNA ligase [Syntrophomonadaceae bacterium]
MEILGPRGTRDILPEESYLWQKVETILHQVALQYGFSEVRLPVFEHTELFERGVGDTTDIVQKEMYTFTDRGQRSITLRPEGTAPSVRSFIEHKFYNKAQPTKWYYMGPMFRYDRPQAGRFRQFHQFGVEAFGTSDPDIDAEVIAILVRIVKTMGISQFQLHLNSVGCPDCRPLYRERLIQYLTPFESDLCADCIQRFHKNPLRILDCKSPKCQLAVKGHPVLSDYLCDRCGQHFEQVKSTLNLYGIDYELDPQLVRGLDYYTKTAFELLLPDLGAQAAIGGGGRYDGLIEECGGPPTPGIGFAIGLERLLSAALKQNSQAWQAKSYSPIDVFVVAAEDEFIPDACVMLEGIRNSGIKADKDYLNRSLKAQMKFAGKTGARWVVVIGEEEKTSGYYILRDMKLHEQHQIPADQIVDEIKSIMVKPEEEQYAE